MTAQVKNRRKCVILNFCFIVASPFVKIDLYGSYAASQMLSQATPCLINPLEEF
jgi:hypothetical protein